MTNFTNTGSTLTLRVTTDNGLEEYVVTIYPPGYSSRHWEVMDYTRQDSTFYPTFETAMAAATHLLVASRTMVR